MYFTARGNDMVYSFSFKLLFSLKSASASLMSVWQFSFPHEFYVCLVFKFTDGSTQQEMRRERNERWRTGERMTGRESSLWQEMYSKCIHFGHCHDGERERERERKIQGRDFDKKQERERKRDTEAANNGCSLTAKRLCVRSQGKVLCNERENTERIYREYTRNRRRERETLDSQKEEEVTELYMTTTGKSQEGSFVSFLCMFCSRFCSLCVFLFSLDFGGQQLSCLMSTFQSLMTVPHFSWERRPCISHANDSWTRERERERLLSPKNLSEPWTGREEEEKRKSLRDFRVSSSIFVSL